MLDRFQRIMVVPFYNGAQWLVRETPMNQDSWYHTALRGQNAKYIIESVRKNGPGNSARSV